MKPFAKLRELLEKSTPGPWDVHSASRGIMGFSKKEPGVGTWVTRDKFNIKADEIFIAEAHNQLPRLLEALDVAVEAMQEELKDKVKYDSLMPVCNLIPALAKIKALGDE